MEPADMPADWPLPDSMLVELGRISALWSALEAHLEVCLGKLAGYDVLGDNRPFIVLKHASFPQRLDMLAALCDTLRSHYKNLAEYGDVIAQLRTAQGERNRYLHNGITRDESGSGFVLLLGSARGKVKRNLEAITAADLQRAAQKIQLAMLSLHKLVTRADYLPTWKRAGA